MHEPYNKFHAQRMNEWKWMNRWNQQPHIWKKIDCLCSSCFVSCQQNALLFLQGNKGAKNLSVSQKWGKKKICNVKIIPYLLLSNAGMIPRPDDIRLCVYLRISFYVWSLLEEKWVARLYLFSTLGSSRRNTFLHRTSGEIRYLKCWALLSIPTHMYTATPL